MSEFIENLENQMIEGPGFGMSAFQILHFTEHLTPERQYRHVLLQLNQKLAALKESYFKQQRVEIDVEEIELKIGQVQHGSLEQRRLKIDLAEKRSQMKDVVKFIKDAEIECELYASILKKIGKTFTRVEFEQAEQGYWEKRLLADAGRELSSTGRIEIGTLRSIQEIGMRPQVNGNLLTLVPATDPIVKLESKA